MRGDIRLHITIAMRSCRHRSFTASRQRLFLLLLLLSLLQKLQPSIALQSMDGLALHDFRGNVTCDPNNALSTWDQIARVCSWDHVACNEVNRVTSLDLSNQGLIGTISPSLGTLEFLKFLNLENNSFKGNIPVSLVSLSHLQELNIANNNLTGPLPDSPSIRKNVYLMSLNSRLLEEQCRNCTTATRGSSSKIYLPIILGVLGGVTGFLLLCISIYYWWKCQKKSGDDAKPSGGPVPVVKESVLLRVESYRSSISEKARNSTRSFTIEELMTATGNFSPSNKIGEGGFGLVYRGTLSTGQEVAIKHAYHDAHQGTDEFYNEVELLSKVHHQYLVDLIGFCDEKGAACQDFQYVLSLARHYKYPTGYGNHACLCEQMLVYEFIPNGNLFEHLCGQRTPPLTWRQRVNIAICCAKALAHLHEGCSPSIIHRDIKPSNILLDNDLAAKVADFGLSKMGPVAGATHVSTGVKGTPGYLDPYYFLSWHLGAYSDVYSFGVILLQLVASKPAVDRKRRNRSTSYSIAAWAKDCLRQGLFDSIVDPKLRLQGYNRDLLLVMVKLGIRCTGEEIKERPSMKTIYQELEHALEILGSLQSVTGSPEGSSRSTSDESEDLAPEGKMTLDEGQGKQFDVTDINFDGRPWVDIKTLSEGDFEELAQDGVEHLVGPNSHLSKDSMHISIDNPELEVAKPV